jgi:serpin B
LKEGFTPKASFNEIATNSFKSEAQTVDFIDNERTAKIINDWVEEKTNNKITNLVTPSFLDAYTQMIIINAIYFKGAWVSKFDVSKTIKARFHMEDRTSVNTDFMTDLKELKFKYDDEAEYTAIEILYSDSDISMMIFLPHLHSSITKLESKISQVDYDQLSQNMSTKKMIVEIPKFKIEFDIDLKSALKKVRKNRIKFY